MTNKSLVDKLRNLFHPYLLPLKGVYFFEFGALSSLQAYIPLFIQHLGLNAAENGIILGILPFISMISKPIAGALVDKFAYPLAILRIFALIKLCFRFSLYFIPPMNQIPLQNISSCINNSFSSPQFWNDVTPGVNFACNMSTSFNESLTIIFTNNSDLSNFDYSSCYNCSWEWESVEIQDSSVVRWTEQIWLTALFLILAKIGNGAVVTLYDAFAFRILANSPVKTTFGGNRVFGTIGFAVFALLVGLLLDNFSETTSSKSDRDFTPAFITFAVVASCGIVTTFFLQVNATGKTSTPSQENDPKASSIWDVLTLDIILFCVGTFVIGVCTGMLYSYLAWYQSELGGSNLLLGITLFVQCAYETPMMAISSWMIRKLGYHGCMLLCLMSFGIRFVAYYFVVDPWFILLIEFTHAFGFGLFYATMASFAFEKAPKDAVATLQGIIGAIYEGFGQGIGSLCAGFLYQTYGGQTTWLGYGILAVVTASSYALFAFLLWKRKPRKNPVDIPLQK